ncbi:hypothetical protein [Aeromicrobium choanae]|nr:hypothetical protein [Aeromicrobium choanae]
MSLGIVVGVGAVTTLAVFTDTVSMTTGTIQAANLDIRLSGQDAWSATSFAAPAMIPGESVAVTVPVQRAVGSTAFTYGATGSVTTSNAFSTNVRLKVYAGSATSGTACPTTTQLAGGTAGTALGTTPTALFGSRTTLATPAAIPTVAQVDNLCLLVTLPTTTPTTAAALSTTLTFAFNATTPGA